MGTWVRKATRINGIKTCLTCGGIDFRGVRCRPCYGASVMYSRLPKLHTMVICHFCDVNRPFVKKDGTIKCGKCGSVNVVSHGKRKVRRCAECSYLKSKEYYNKRKEHLSAYNKKYIKNDLGRNAARAAKYRYRKHRATPEWLSVQQLKQIESFYVESDRLSVQTGIKHNVDHIVPIKGRNFCGLHVPWNLQILTQTENSSKGNRLNIKADLAAW